MCHLIFFTHFTAFVPLYMCNLTLTLRFHCNAFHLLSVGDFYSVKNILWNLVIMHILSVKLWVLVLCCRSVYVMWVIDGLRWCGCHGVTVSHQTFVWSGRYVLHMAVLASPASHDRAKTKNWHSHLPSLQSPHYTRLLSGASHTFTFTAQNTSHSRRKLSCKCHFMLTIKFIYSCWVHTCLNSYKCKSY